jgi:O-antigen/teichoic acid export membrane protein
VKTLQSLPSLFRSTTATNSYLNLAGQAIPLLIGIVLVPVTLHGLGIAQFGLLSIALTVLEYSALFALGLGPATTKHVAESIARDDDEASTVIVISILGNTLLGMIGCICVVLLAPFLATRVFHVATASQADAIHIFRLIGLMVPASLLLLGLFGALEGAGRFGLVNGMRIPLSSLSFIIPAVAVKTGYGLTTILTALVILRFAACVVLAFLVAAGIPGFRWHWPSRWAPLRSLLSFGAWLSVSSVVSPTLVYADRFILAHIRGLAAIGYYSAPFDAVMRILIIPSSLTRAVFPKVSGLHGTQRVDALAQLFRSAVAVVLALLAVPILVLFIFAPFLLRVWLGPDVAHAASTATRILAVGVLFNALAFVPSNFLSALGRPDVNAKLHLIELCIQLPLAWWLVSTFGIAGAATAWSTRVTLDALLLFWACSRELGHRRDHLPAPSDDPLPARMAG